MDKHFKMLSKILIFFYGLCGNLDTLGFWFGFDLF